MNPLSRLALSLEIFRATQTLGPQTSDRLVELFPQWTPRQVKGLIAALMRSGHLKPRRTNARRFHWANTGPLEPALDNSNVPAFLYSVDANSVWTNFLGERKRVGDLDQQHLSNIWWFFLLHFGWSLEWVTNQLWERFDGAMLPYRPHPGFSTELERLAPRLILSNDDPGDAVVSGDRFVIMLNNVPVGELYAPPGKLRVA